MGEVYVPGVAGVVVFYLAVLGVGIWAAAAKRKQIQNGRNDDRGLGLCLGVFTLVATWVGGAYVNGTAEAMFKQGLAWCQVPFGYSLSLFFGAIIFARPMRNAEYVTMLDPFQQHYGSRVGGLLFLPALFGDLFWCGAVLSALGSSLSVVAGVEPSVSICASAFLAAIYTVFGGMYSVACTDALQLACIALGLTIAAPFAVLHPAVSLEKNFPTKDWLGEIKREDSGVWLDGMLLLVFGGIPWQGYFQRILSVKSASISRTLSLASTFGCVALAVPSALLGTVARATDWSSVSEYNYTASPIDGSVALPFVLRYLTPKWVSFIGLGAISAAAMSSADSSILASSSMFARNVYRLTVRPKASERELNWILRVSVLVVSFLSAAVALTVGSVYYLSYLCSDLVYVVLFPQLLSVVHWPSFVDTYGCLAGYAVALVLRVAGGEKGLGLPPLIEYPFYDYNERTQKFPFRTTAMISALCTQLLVSFFTRNLLGKGYFPRCCDVLSVYSAGPGKQKDRVTGGVIQSGSGAALVDAVVDEATIGSQDFGNRRGDRPAVSTASEQPSRHETVDEVNAEAARNAIRNLRESQDPQNAVPPSPNRVATQPPSEPVPQVLGVRNLVAAASMTRSEVAPTSAQDGADGAPEKARDSGERRGTGVNQESTGVVKKNVKGVKLVGMEGGPLRRPSLQQGAFSPTPSVELVHILDRRQSNGSYGPGSLSPVPGVEACRTHGTAVGGQSGNERCRLKRGIVRHHSFNDTSDRALTTLARQPAYPSMPLRAEDCRMTLVKREKKPNAIARHSSVADEANLSGCGLVLGPTYGLQYAPAAKSNRANYFVADDEAISRF